MLFQNGFEFYLGTRIVCAAGLVQSLGTEVARLGGSRVLLISDDGLRRAGLLAQVEASLAAAVELVAVFDQTPPNSSRQAVEAAAALAQTQKVDLLVALGGGSVIDTAKGVRLLLATGSLATPQHAPPTVLPLIALPTTAGTGAEASTAAVIDDAGVQLRLRHPSLAPTLALLDPELTLTLPPLLTGATGMQALSHAIEAFVATTASPFGDSLALYAIDLIGAYLRDATHAAEDLNARSAMLVAASMAGLAFANAAPGIVSAMVDVVSRSGNIHPGALHGILLPFGMQFNAQAVPNRYQRIARALGVVAGGRPERDVIGDSVTEVRSLAADCNLPLRLRDVGVSSDALPALAEAAAAADLATNPRPVSADDVLCMIEEAW